MFAGFGAGMILFRQTQAGGLQLYDATAAQTGHLRANGMVREIVPLADRIYAAAATNGVVSYDRPSLLQGPTLTPTPFEDIWAVDVAEVGSTDVVVAGSNVGEICGSLYVFSASGSSWYQAWALHIGKAVHSIDAVKDLFAGKITIFVGTGCGGIQVYNVPSDLSSFPTSALATFSGPASVYMDLQHHAGPDGVQRLYGAAYHEGVRAFALTLGTNPDSLTFQEQSGQWPILASSGSNAFYARGLSLDGNRLAMAFGNSIDKQFIGDCDPPYPCVMPNLRGTTLWGVQVRDVTSLTSPVNIGMHLVTPSDPRGAMDVVIRSKSSNLYYVDIAGLASSGVVTLRGLLQGTNWSLTQEAVPFSTQYGLAQGQPLPSNNAMYLQDGALNSPTEGCNAVYNTAEPDPSNLLRNPTAVVLFPPTSSGLPPQKMQCFSGFPNGGPGLPGRIYGISKDLVVYDATDPLHPVATGSVSLGGDGLLGRAMQGLSSPPATPPPRWFIAALYDPDGSTDGRLRIWNVGYGTDPSAITEVISYQHPNGATKYWDVAARPIDASSAWLYASYLRSYLDAGVTKYEAGLLRVKMTATGTAPPFEFTDAQLVPAVADTGGSGPWRVTVDPDVGAVYVALGCFGWAVYGDADPAAGPPFLSYVKSATSWSDPTKSMVVFEVLRGYLCTDSGFPIPPTYGLYVSALNQGIAFWTNYASGSVGQLRMYRNRLQSIGIVLDPTDPTRRTLYGSDTQAGVNRIWFDPVQFP